MHESQLRPPAWFVTLTYSPENVPENGSLNPADPKRFVERLRRRTRRRLGYYLCGEYGSKTKRPHYHAVLYGADLLDRARRTTRHGAPVWVSPTLETAWGLGHHELTPVNAAAAYYVAGYVTKKQRPQDAPHQWTRVNPLTGELVELEPEFMRSSRRPAIGRRWIERYWRDVYPRDAVIVDGRETRPPRYYDKWLEANHPELMAQVRDKRWAELEELTKDQLRAMDAHHRARNELFNRRDKV